MSNLEGIKSTNQKNPARDARDVNSKLKDAIKLVEDLQQQNLRINERLKLVESRKAEVEKSTLIELIAAELKKGVVIEECLKYENLASGL